MGSVVEDPGDPHATRNTCYCSHRRWRAALAVNNYIPMDRKIKSILNGVVVIAVVLWLLSVFGLLDGITNYRIGKLN